MARILIIDDSLIMRRTIRLMLESDGHTVAGEADDGNDIIASYQACDPDIVTLDLMMNKIDGIDALKKLKDRFPQARVIIVSSKGNRENVIEAMKAGADNFIVKPLDRKKLADAIGCILNNPKEKHERGLEVINKQGVFDIKVFNIIDRGLMDQIINTIKGLLIIKPLSVRFDLENLEFASEDIENDFSRVFDLIRSVNGEIL